MAGHNPWGDICSDIGVVLHLEAKAQPDQPQRLGNVSDGHWDIISYCSTRKPSERNDAETILLALEDLLEEIK